MTQTTARITKAGKHFEIMVDMEAALAYKKGEGTAVDFLEIDKIFSDSKKGEVLRVERLRLLLGQKMLLRLQRELLKKEKF